MYIFFLLIFCSSFLGKLLIARGQNILFGAESDDGCLAEINMDSAEKRILYNILPHLLR